MLVLARKRNQEIRIGDQINIRLISTGRGHVKIGIEAPGHMAIMRAELIDPAGPAGNNQAPDQE